MGIWVLPNANSIDVVKRVRTEMEEIQKELPTGMTGAIAYDATAYINDAIHEVMQTLSKRSLSSSSLFFSSSVRSVRRSCRWWRFRLAHRRGFPDAGFGFTLDLLTLLAIVLSVGLVVDDAIVVVENVERHLREGMRVRRRHSRRTRTGRSDHRDDDHARGGLHADRFTGRVDWFALSRIRFHPGRRGPDFRRGRAHPVTDDVGETFARRREEKGLARSAIAFSIASAISTGATRLDFAVRPAVYAVWVALGGFAILMFVLLPFFPPSELAPTEDQGVVSESWMHRPTRPSSRPKPPRKKPAKFSSVSRRPTSLSKSPPRFRLWRNGFETVGRAHHADRGPGRTADDEIDGDSRDSNVPRHAARATRGGQFPVEFVLESTAEPERILEFAKLSGKSAAKRNVFLSAAHRHQD